MPNAQDGFETWLSRIIRTRSFVKEYLVVQPVRPRPQRPSTGLALHRETDLLRTVTHALAEPCAVYTPAQNALAGPL